MAKDLPVEISVYNRNSLLIKDPSIIQRYSQFRNQLTLSDDIYLPGYEDKPIKIGVNITSSFYEIRLRNTDLNLNDVAFHHFENQGLNSLSLSGLDAETNDIHHKVELSASTFINNYLEDDYDLFRRKTTSPPKPLFSSLRKNADTSYDSGIGLDFEIIIDGKVIKASKFVLSQNSTVFAAMLRNESKDKIENRIDSKDASHDAMLIFVKILHGIAIETVTPAVAIELVAIADKYEVLEIKEQASQFAKWLLSEQNVVDALIVAHRVGAKDMEEAALAYITSDKFGDLDELTGFTDAPPDILSLMNKAYRTKFIKQRVE